MRCGERTHNAIKNMKGSKVVAVVKNLQMLLQICSIDNNQFFVWKKPPLNENLVGREEDITQYIGTNTAIAKYSRIFSLLPIFTVAFCIAT